MSIRFFSYLSLLIALVVSVSIKYVYAYDVLISISGNITANTCDVTSDVINVQLGNYNVKNLNQPGTLTQKVNFTIELANCPSTFAGVNVMFVGATDSICSECLKITSGAIYSKGVAIKITDANTKTVIPNVYGPLFGVRGTTKLSIPYFAQYISTTSTVTPGNANSTATFTLQYP